ncbi:hypothetical protein L1278_003287 [Pontibacter sp. HSC-36F09]|nr:hypothetical protein [Pontibacter sp. HSC-36F09]
MYLQKVTFERYLTPEIDRNLQQMALHKRSGGYLVSNI